VRPAPQPQAGAASRKRRAEAALDALAAQAAPAPAQPALLPAPVVAPQPFQVVQGSLNLSDVWLSAGKQLLPWAGYKPAYPAPELPAGGAEGAARPHAVACTT
jgi:hypothetical protein